MTTAKKRIWIKIFLILLVFFQILCIKQTFAASENQKFTYGFKLFQYDLKKGDSVADNPIPTIDLGCFVAKKSEFTYREVVDKIKIPVSTARLYRAFGYLNVTDPGTYTIITTSQSGPKYGCIFVNKKLAVSDRNDGFVLAAPAHFSQPGLYEIDIRIYDSINKDLVVPKTCAYTPSAKFNFMIKTPEDDMPQPAHKVLLLPLR